LEVRIETVGVTELDETDGVETNELETGAPDSVTMTEEKAGAGV
jgi:hypothetical protein